MRDGWLRSGIKGMVRGYWSAEHALRRRLFPARLKLGGACGGCARCCEAPTLRVGRLVFFPLLRAALIAWHRWINGFELLRVDRPARSLVFRCTHLDPATRRCDSYPSRPFLCRDYPRNLLDQPWPEFFRECGFRPVDRRPLDLSGLPPELQDRLKERLRVE